MELPVELAEQPVNGVEEGLSQVGGQRIPDRIVGAVGRSTPHRRGPQRHRLLVAEPIRERLEEGDPARQTAGAGLGHEPVRVAGGGVSRIGGRTFPLRHPHLAMVLGLLVSAPEVDREHEVRFVLLDPDGGEVAGATGNLQARGHTDGRDTVLTFSIDLWNLTFPAPGDYSFRILVNGSERKRLPLLLLKPADAGTDGDGMGTKPADD